MSLLNTLSRSVREAIKLSEERTIRENKIRLERRQSMIKGSEEKIRNGITSILGRNAKDLVRDINMTQSKLKSSQLIGTVMFPDEQSRSNAVKSLTDEFGIPISYTLKSYISENYVTLDAKINSKEDPVLEDVSIEIITNESKTIPYL